MTKTLQELTDLIIEWGAEKGIYEKSSYEYQLNKTLEEVTELHKAILDDDIEQIKDAIGDIYVTLVMAGHFDKSVNSAINDYISHYIQIRNYCKLNSHCDITSILSYISTLIVGTEFVNNTIDLLTELTQISEDHDLRFTKCVEHAYNIISKRKGKMIGGVFEKDK